MKAIILVGGKGTRLGKVTARTPKPLVAVGDKPVLRHQLEMLKRAGIDEVIISAHHFAQAIEDYIADLPASFPRVRVVVESSPRGTAGAVADIAKHWNEDFLVLYGDVMMDVDVKHFVSWHMSKAADVSLALHPNDHPFDSDLVMVEDDGRISGWHPSPHDGQWRRNLVSAGLYMMHPRVLTSVPSTGMVDFGKHVFPILVKSNVCFGYVTPEYLKDMGTPKRLKEVRGDLASGLIPRRSRQHARPTIFLDRDGVINEYISHIHILDDFRLLQGVASAIRHMNQAGYLVVVVTNQPVVARGLCSEDDVRHMHCKMETLLGNEGAYVDAIYFCPHHPDKGFEGENVKYKIECECRKPKTGMVRQAVKDWNIDLASSWLIGDSVRDVACGRAAGIKTIAVGKLAGGSEVGGADLVCADLPTAVAHVLMQTRQEKTLVREGQGVVH